MPRRLRVVRLWVCQKKNGGTGRGPDIYESRNKSDCLTSDRVNQTVLIVGRSKMDLIRTCCYFCCCCCLCEQEQQSQQEPTSHHHPNPTSTTQTIENDIAVGQDPQPIDTIPPTETNNTNTSAPIVEEQEIAVGATDTSAASVTVPPKATAGSTISVVWKGPGESGDYVGISKANTDGYLHYTYLTKGSNTVQLLVPAQAGVFDVKYMQEAHADRVLAQTTIETIEPDVKLFAPESAVCGSTIDVDWKGYTVGLDWRGNNGDFIGISRAGENGYIKYTYVSESHTVKLLAPADPGLYDIKYMMESHNDKVLATKQIQLTAAEASLQAPTTAMAGTTIEVEWNAQSNSGDFIGVSRLNETGYLQYTYVYDKSPVRLLLPADSGEYELKYMLEEHNDKVIARRKITLKEATATIQAPTEAVAGSTITIQWSGPDNDSDFLGISRADADGYTNYTYFHHSNPVTLTVPETPGMYDLKYMMEQHNDRVLAKHRIQILPT